MHCRICIKHSINTNIPAVLPDVAPAVLPDVAPAVLPDVANINRPTKKHIDTRYINKCIARYVFIKQLFDIKMKTINAKGKVYHFILKVSPNTKLSIGFMSRLL